MYNIFLLTVILFVQEFQKIESISLEYKKYLNNKNSNNKLLLYLYYIVCNLFIVFILYLY